MTNAKAVGFIPRGSAKLVDGSLNEQPNALIHMIPLDLTRSC
jgi:hypothetical protein